MNEGDCPPRKNYIDSEILAERKCWMEAEARLAVLNDALWACRGAVRYHSSACALQVYKITTAALDQL